MAKSALSRCRVGSWIVPIGLLALSLALHACGGSDGCGDINAEGSDLSCARWALGHSCGVVTSDFNSETNVCEASNCRVCPTNTPVKFTPSIARQPTNTPVPLPPGFDCNLSTTINTPRPTPGVTPDLASLCNDFAVTKVCGSPDYEFQPDTGVCVVSNCGICSFPDDVF
jgi:hypothetical protein